jgi:arginase
MAGLQRAGIEPLLIWFDAHGDFNTWETTPSGFLGGMPLAMLAGLGEQTMLHALDLHPLTPERIILTDGRDLDPGERELIAECAVAHFRDPLHLLDYHLAERPLYIHFDTDIINPLDAPAMSYAAKGGPRPAELAQVFRHLAQTKQITAVSLSTWNPSLDVDGRSAETCMHLLRELLGADHPSI